DGDAGHADVAGHARMIAVVAAMRRQIEGDREALLSGGEVAPVERIGILRGGESGVLPDGPWLRRVHGRVGAAQIRRDAGISVEAREAREVVRSVGRFDGNAFGRTPWRFAAGGRGHLHRSKLHRREIRDAAHRFDSTPRISWAAVSVATASHPAKMKVPTPASFSESEVLRRPSRQTRAAPAAFSAFAASIASRS